MRRFKKSSASISNVQTYGAINLDFRDQWDKKSLFIGDKNYLKGSKTNRETVFSMLSSWMDEEKVELIPLIIIDSKEV